MNKQKLVALTVILVVTLSMVGLTTNAAASLLAATSPSLGAAASYSVLGKAGVTNSGNSVLSGNVGADTSISGFPPGTAFAQVLAPTVDGAEADASTAYFALTSQSPGTSVGPDLSGETLTPGVYSVGSALLSGTLTLNGAGTYIFLVSSDLTSSGTVSLINGATPCDVFWQVTSSAAINGGTFVGTIIANTSITFGDSASLDGRALALTGNVTLINNSISGPSCASAPVETSATATLLPGVSGLPSTGGGPIQNEVFPWGMLIVAGFSIMVISLGVRASRRNHMLK